MQSLDHSCDRKLEIDPCIQGSKLWVHMGWNPSYLSQSHSATQIHIQQGSCPDSHTLWQAVQFTLTVDRTAGCELDTRQRDCVWVCLHVATAEPALAQTLGSQRICSWWSQTFPPWRKAGGTAQYQTSCCREKADENNVFIQRGRGKYSVTQILLHNHSCYFQYCFTMWWCRFIVLTLPLLCFSFSWWFHLHIHFPEWHITTATW